MKPMVSPTDLSPKLHWPRGPQGHDVCSPASWKHTRRAEFSLLCFHHWPRPDGRVCQVHLKKRKGPFPPEALYKGVILPFVPLWSQGGTKTSLLPPSNWKPFYWKNALYDEDEIRKIIIIMMFGSMRLSAWKHNKSPCKQRGKLPTEFSCTPGGLGKSIASPST